MRPTRLARLVGVTLLVALLLPSAALAAAAPVGAAAGNGPAAPAAIDLPRFRLGCALVIPGPIADTREPRVVCRWAALEGVEVRAYRVWRIVDPGSGNPRELLATVAADQPLRHVDRDIAWGHDYLYRVVALGPDGQRVGLSNRALVHVGRPVQQLRFNCAVVIDADRQGVLCRWSETSRRRAVKYVLYRSVDGGPREAIYRTRIDGRQRYFDTDVQAGQTIRYAVVARTRSGRVVAIGGPDTVVIPALTVAAAR